MEASVDSDLEIWCKYNECCCMVEMWLLVCESVILFLCSQNLSLSGVSRDQVSGGMGNMSPPTFGQGGTILFVLLNIL